jgi:hypothetical protein
MAKGVPKSTPFAISRAQKTRFTGTIYLLPRKPPETLLSPSSRYNRPA